MNKSDKEIILKAIQGDNKSISSLIEKYYGRILYTAIQRFGIDIGTDVAHKAVVEVIQSLKNLKDPEKFEIWMMRVVRFVCINELKLKYRDQKVFTEFENGDPDTYYVETDDQEFIPEDYIIHLEKRERVLEVIKTLPQNYQDALIDFFFHQMTYEEMAEVNGSDKTKIRNDLYRGKMLLKKRLEAIEGKEFTYSVGIGALPILSQIFQADVAATLTPNICTGFIGGAQKALSRLGGSGGSIGATTTTVAMKVVAGSIMAVGLAGGIILAVNYNGIKEPVTQPPVAITSTVQTTEATTEEIAVVINTLEDMIGVDEAEQLNGFQARTLDKSKWLDFIEHIGAEVETVSIEHDQKYTMYLLYKQDKQLVLAERSNTRSNDLEVFYQFGDIDEPPRMIKIILEFDSK